jgi:DNA polymerase-1
MVHLHDYLADKKARMLLQVHDEIVFEVHKDELDIVPHLQSVMESVYQPSNNMKLTCGVEYSWTSWGKQDAEEGLPT